MSEMVAGPAPSKLLRLARIAAIVGMLGLGVAAFIEPLDDPKGTPAMLLTDPGTASPTLISTRIIWILYGEYAFPPLLLLCYGAGRLIQGKRARSVLGWIACLACFVVLLAVSLGLWREIIGRGMNLKWQGSESIVLHSWLLLAAAMTLALLSLCAAPARLRLPGCVALTGIWSLVVFLVILAAHFLSGGQFHLLFGYWLSLVSAILMAAGGTTETIILWKRGDDLDRHRRKAGGRCCD